jgi:hypothetical protein
VALEDGDRTDEVGGCRRTSPPLRRRPVGAGVIFRRSAAASSARAGSRRQPGHLPRTARRQVHRPGGAPTKW